MITKDTKLPCICIVDAPWNIFHGEKVKVISPCGMVIDGQMQYNCVLTDGNGGGMLPANILIPAEDER